MKRLALVGLACLALVVAGCGGGSDSSSSTEASESTAESKASAESGSGGKSGANTDMTKKPKVTVPKGAPPKELEITEIVEGTGEEAKAGDEVTVQYVGVGYESGEEFDSSWSRNEPFPFQLGAGLVIKGWDQGVEGMKVGGRRELIIPPELAYGESPPSPAIGPNETLIFIVDLLAVK